MNVLELFSGTGSVGKCCKELGWDAVSVDLILPADHQVDIMDFDYKQYPKDFFDIEIINYFDCEYYFIENPQTGKLKDQEFMKDLPFVDCDYCMYGKPYRKRTRIWTNKKCNMLLCNKKCGSFKDGKHVGSCGNGLKKYSDKSYSLSEKYSIPKDLIYSLFLD
jgi:hypothetical protein